MTDLPPTTQEIIDNEHLKLLSIVHYVFGALHAALSCILIIHFIIGLVMAIVPQFSDHGPQGPPALFGMLISLFAGCFMVLGWLFGGLTVYSGVCIKRRQHRTFSLIMAVVNCLSIPFGTALGIFTIIVLSRDSVRRIYGEPTS